MKALTLWQPWASLIALDVKTNETRSWPPPAALIGERIAIHAAKKKPPPMPDLVLQRFTKAAGCHPRLLPRGVVVCTAVVRRAWQVDRHEPTFRGRPHHACSSHDAARSPLAGVDACDGGFFCDIDEWGNYDRGRWVWVLDQVEKPPRVLSIRGGQRIWSFDDALLAD